MTALLTSAQLDELSVAIHAGNVAAGWWTDLTTGESLAGRRNVGELLMLCVTEISEADEGFMAGAMDDKLPHRPMIEVELADCAIWLFDLIGGYKLQVAQAYEDLTRGREPQDWGPRPPSAQQVRGHLLHIVGGLSRAMEAFRKGRTQAMEGALAQTLLCVFELGRRGNYDVAGAIAEKRAFNATREDHKPENRRAADGKKV